MTTEPSHSLRTLLEHKIDTFEKLELVLALRAAGRPMTMDELALQLQVGRDALRRVALEIEAAGIVQMIEHDGVRLVSGPWEPQIAEAQELYAADPAKMLKLLSSIAMARIRGMAARTFAEAFRIRKKGD